jgi:hypothetical protein
LYPFAFDRRGEFTLQAEAECHVAEIRLGGAASAAGREPCESNTRHPAEGHGFYNGLERAKDDDLDESETRAGVTSPGWREYFEN